MVLICPWLPCSTKQMDQCALSEFWYIQYYESSEWQWRKESLQELNASKRREIDFDVENDSDCSGLGLENS